MDRRGRCRGCRRPEEREGFNGGKRLSGEQHSNSLSRQLWQGCPIEARAPSHSARPNITAVCTHAEARDCRATCSMEALAVQMCSRYR
eukprot:scaffold144369_cov172-Phaeocystis_antarctica.AAC.2